MMCWVFEYVVYRTRTWQKVTLTSSLRIINFAQNLIEQYISAQWNIRALIAAQIEQTRRGRQKRKQSVGIRSQDAPRPKLMAALKYLTGLSIPDQDKKGWNERIWQIKTQRKILHLYHLFPTGRSGESCFYLSSIKTIKFKYRWEDSFVVFWTEIELHRISWRHRRGDVPRRYGFRAQPILAVFIILRSTQSWLTKETSTNVLNLSRTVYCVAFYCFAE